MIMEKIDLTKCNNCRYKARLDGDDDYGRIKVDCDCVYLRSDKLDGCVAVWHTDDPIVVGLSARKVTDFEIVPRDPETYRDWQVGDKVICPDEKWKRIATLEVIFRSGELVAMKDLDGCFYNCYTCQELLTEGYQLVLTDIERQIIEKKKKYEPQDGDVCFVRTDAGNCFIFIKREHKPEEEIHSYACFDTDLWSLCSTKVSCVCDRQSIRELRLATEDEKQKLFNAMAKKGKRWNAEKKVVEDIPKPYEFKKGEPVLVRDNDENIWILSSFIQFIPTSCFHVTNGVRPSHWKQCIPYNERTMHLLGTSDKEGEK